MRIRMLGTQTGTEDGFHLRRYYAGQEYECGDMLARGFIASGLAVAVEPNGHQPSNEES